MPGKLRRLPPPILLAAAVIVAALASALVSHRAGSPPGAAADPSQEESLAQPVEAAFGAARRGDVDAYLSQFTGAPRTELNRLRTEKGDVYLRSYIQQLSSPVKGLAANLGSAAPIGPDLVRLPVDVSFADHNETQQFDLQHERGAWRILAIHTTRSAPILIPYGTPIEQVAPLPHPNLP